ncbi:hypothetical protein GGU10DRAFT_308302 [Lentinula aff. detonsa]|uniref:Uncharacterized protein n=1 Tax=Lentinula aff. detonsa TaxID=2804958 RepID=A0AA38NMX8_9AGAR|nr:hypothetical protein GGU10DRAFT_308302 [Lentinula aff. detonsa]
MPNPRKILPYQRFADDETANPKFITRSKDEEIRSSKSNKNLFIGKTTNVPVPIPETGVTTSVSPSASPTTASRTTLSPYASVAPISLMIPSSFSSPTPTTLNLVSSTYPITKASSSVILHPTDTVSTISLPSPSTAIHPALAAHKLPITIIAVLAVGSAFFLLGIFIVIKACTRPTRRTRPKPSLPILDDAFADDDLYSPTKVDSPIFGGKEHMSSQNENGAPGWTWTQYSEAKTQANPPLPDSQALDLNTSTLHPISLGETIGPNDFLFPRPPPSQSVPTTLISNTSHFGIPNLLANAASRLSIARSVSVYPASPLTAAGDGKNYTADGHPIIKRSSKIGLRKSRSDMTEVTSRLSRDSLAYDGADLKSPQFLAHCQAEAPSAPVGRTRIKSSYYTPGSYPRMSSLPSSTSTKNSKAKGDDIIGFNIHELPPIQRSNSHKDRDTKALTSALGLASPPMETIPLSPVQTLYPDDSLSVADMKRMPSQKKHSKKPAVALSPVDTSTALGSLMLMDFGTTVSGLAARLGDTIEYSSSKKIPLQYDKPPRVPSPPPLPSLAQMGLEHANPDAYAEYRSPTYSIFGLYGEDRKSRLSMQSKFG